MSDTRRIDHDFSLQLYKQDDSPLGRAGMEVDWEPALEWCHLLGIRRGKLLPMLNIGRHRIEPVWDAEIGRPFVSGFRTVLCGNDAGEGFACEFPITYFASLALEASEAYVRTGRIHPGDRIRYRVTASDGRRASQTEAGVSRPRGFSVREVPKPMPLGSKSLRRLRDRSVPFETEEQSDMPVFIPKHVLEEACAQTREAGAYEVGSVLVGHLLRDKDSPEIMAEITARVPIRSGERKLYSMSITAESWAEVRNTIRLRGRNEMMLAWTHSHAFMKELCQNCRRVEDRSCTQTAVFMSDKDRALQRTVFYRAYHLALVLGDTPCNGLQYGLFGWKYGGIHRRGFRILHAGRPGADPARNLHEKGTEGEKGERNVG